SRKSWVTRLLDRFNHWFNGLAERYQRVVGWALDHRIATMVIAAAAFFGAIALQSTVGGAGFMPVSDNSELNMLVETEPGSSLAYTRLKAEEAARIARTYPEVQYTYTTIGGTSGAVDTASVYVKLLPKAERMLPLAKKVPGAVDVGLSTRGQKPEIEVELQRGLASALGLSVGQVAQSMYPAFAGLDAGDWVDPTGETRDVVVRLSPEARQRAADLARLPLTVQGPNGPTSVPLGQVATIREGLGPATVQHLDSDRAVIIQANVSGHSFNEVKDGIRRAIATVPLPPGTRITEGGEAKDQAEVFGKIFAALGIAVVLMYLILVMQFGSFLDPVAIMLSLPLSLIGVVAALIITGDTLNIMSLIGVILLC